MLVCDEVWGLVLGAMLELMISKTAMSLVQVCLIRNSLTAAPGLARHRSAT